MTEADAGGRPRGPALLLVALVLLGFGAVGRLAIQAWLVKSAPDDLPEIGATTDRAHPFCLVVIDGLSEAAAWADQDPPMPWLQAFARRGASGIAMAGDPTLTAPCVRALLTGRAPDLVTAFRNFNARPVPGSLIGYLADRGARTAHAGDATIYQLCRPHFAQGSAFAVADRGSVDQGETDDMALPFLLARVEEGADVVSLHLTRPDHAGHLHGATGRAYRDACRIVDGQVKRLVESFLERHPDALVLVAADHGVTATGSHGGGELTARRAPFVLVGPGVARKGGLLVAQVQLAPTIAALLGLPQPPLADGPPSRDLLDLPEEVELAALDAYVRARLAVARLEGTDAVDPIERRRAEVFEARLAPQAATELLDLAGDLNRRMAPSAAGYAAATLLLALLWLVTVVHLASTEVGQRAALRLAGLALVLLVLALGVLPPLGAGAALLLTCVLALRAARPRLPRAGLLSAGLLVAVPVLTGASLSLQAAVEAAEGGGQGWIAGMLLALALVLLWGLRPRVALGRLAEIGPRVPGLVPAFGGLALGFTLTLTPFANPILGALHPAIDLTWLFALVGLVAVGAWLLRPATPSVARGRAGPIAALALLLFAGPRVADVLLEGSWLDQVARRDDAWLLAGVLVLPLVVLAVGVRRLSRQDVPGILLALLALGAGYAVRIDPDPGPLVARGGVLLGLAALVCTTWRGTPDGRLLVRLLAAVALARRLTALDGELLPFVLLAVGAGLAARLPVARGRLALAWTALGLLAVRIATFHAMGGTESFSTVDVAAGFVGLRATGGPEALTEGAGGVTWPVVEAGLQLCLRFALPWIVLLAAFSRAAGSPAVVRRVVGDVALTFAGRGAAIALALWAWWRSAWWMEKAYPVFALGAADVVLLLLAAALVGAFAREPGGYEPSPSPSLGGSRFS